jgi:hypothetical protein
MKRIPVRHPGISVKLIKNVGRSLLSGSAIVSERFAGQNRIVDLEPFLSERSRITVSKSVREPAGGFSLTFIDRIDEGAEDSLYGLFEPMDLVEIRMASKSAADGSEIPIMMRGFISRVQRRRSMGDDGKPMRTITVTGQDYGKIWQILQVFFLPNLPDVGNMITSFPFFARFGLSMQTMRADEFVSEIFAKIINPYITEMGGQGGGDSTSTALMKITPDIEIVDGIVSPFGTGNWRGGTIYSLLMENCDVGPWNELFIEDRDDGPYVVYRPNPFMAADGKTFIQPLKKVPDIIAITSEDVVSQDDERSDEHVANYFWVDAPRFALNRTEVLRAMTYQGDPSTFFIQDYGNVNPKLYGTRKMWEQTMQGGLGETDSGNGTPAGGGRQITDASATAWINARRKVLVEQNKDNVLFESGSMRLKGNENIRAGTYVRIIQGSMEPDYYAVSVQHDFVPFDGFYTTVNYERGRGFIERAMQGGGAASPYWTELSDNE